MCTSFCCVCPQLLAVVIKGLLRVHRGDCQAAGAVLSEACSALRSMLGDSTPVVLKAVCEALQLCLPSLATSSQPATGMQCGVAHGIVTPLPLLLAVAMVELLLPFRSSPYWLAKVELLRTVSCLPLTALSISQPQLPRTILTHVVFSLLGDQDHRSVCEQPDLRRAVTPPPSLPSAIAPPTECEQLLQRRW